MIFFGCSMEKTRVGGGEININPGPGGSKKTLKMEDHSNAGCPCSLYHLM